MEKRTDNLDTGVCPGLTFNVSSLDAASFIAVVKCFSWVLPMLRQTFKPLLRGFSMYTGVESAGLAKVHPSMTEMALFLKSNSE